jgi:O-antigen/teichoic acid export membrane protein
VVKKTIKELGKFAFADGGSIKSRVLRSGIWVGAGQIVSQLLGIARSIALARLLSPDVFGFIALAMIVVRAIETFTRPGIAQALIARQQAFEEVGDTAFTLLVARGVLLSLVLIVAAPFVGSFYENAELETVLMVLSVVFVINGLTNVNLIARQRELDYRRVTYLGQASTIVGTIVTIAMAWWLRSVWALVIGQIVQASATALLSYYFVAGRPQFAFNKDVASDLLRYGKFITGSSIVTFILTETDSAVIGKLLGMEQLGHYALAATISSLVILSFSQMVSGIMMAAYSKLQTDLSHLRTAYLQALSMLMFIVVPASAGLICLTDPLIYVVYGEKWLPATIPLQVFAVFGVPRALLIFNGYLFEGIGKPHIAFQLGLLRLAIVLPLIIPAVMAYGLLGAAVIVVSGAVVQCLVGLLYLRRYTKIRLPEVVATIWRPLWSASLMSLIVIGASNLLDPRTLTGLSTAVLSGVAVYFLINAKILMKLKKERYG